MIDVEPIVFDKIYHAVKEKFPEADIKNIYVESAAVFPCVCIVEDDNKTYQRTLDGYLFEHHAELLYTVTVYSNKKNGKKEEARAIVKVIDEAMQSIKFTRIMLNQIPNADQRIYRIVGRYKAIVSEGIKQSDGTIKYQIYR